MKPAGAVLVIDDDAAVRESVEALLVSEGFDVETFGAAADFLDAVGTQEAACILLDVRMPGMDGLTLLERLAERGSDVPSVMMTGHGDLPIAVRAMRAGAADFIEKPFEPERLIDSIRHAISKASRRTATVDPEAAASFAALTPRETEVMKQMVIGKPNKLIADALQMSPRTVEIHRARVMQKTGSKSLSHLVRMALKVGFDPDA